MNVIQKQSFNKICPVCNNPFTAHNNAQVYCSHRCRTKRQHAQKIDQEWRNKPRVCPICNTEFIIPEGSSPIRKYCSEECQVKGYSQHTDSFKKANPESMKTYNANRKLKYGTDSLTTRLYKKYPDLPKCCEAERCKENRVFDFAHKPSHKRNGAFRTIDQYERHKFWVLCPNHHALIDRGVLHFSELGLTE